MSNSFPEIVFGKCNRCNKMIDDLTPPDGFAVARNSEGEGNILIMYLGEYMCQLCKKRLQADRESKTIASNIAREERFRGKAGYRKSMED